MYVHICMYDEYKYGCDSDNNNDHYDKNNSNNSNQIFDNKNNNNDKSYD